jgi:uncharacterized membrane protein YphA (DoxX/SURF4 family)
MFKEKLLTFFNYDKTHLVLQLVLGGIFVYASIGKILQPHDFMTAIRNYRILPEFLISITAYVLPWMELLFGSLLILNIYPRFSATILSLMLLVFICAISSALIRGINIECGCFLQKMMNNGHTPPANGFLLIIRDILFLFPGIIITFFKKPTHQSAVNRPAESLTADVTI